MENLKETSVFHPHIIDNLKNMNRVQKIKYLKSIFVQDRDGIRQGFNYSVFNELMAFYHELDNEPVTEPMFGYK